MECSLRIQNSKVTAELNKLIGFNAIKENSVFLEAFGSDDFTKEFKDWYKINHPEDNEPNIDTTSETEASKLAKAMQDFYYHNHPSINRTARVATNDKVIVNGYNSLADREEGKIHIGTKLLEVFNTVQAKNIDLGKDKLTFYTNQAKNYWQKVVFNLISSKTGKSIDKIKQEFEEAKDQYAYIDKAIGGHGKTISDKNILAVYKELFSSIDTAKKYIEEVLSNVNYSDILHQVKPNLDEELAKKNAEANADQNEVTNDEGQVDSSNDVEFDTMISSANNHHGQYSSFMTHVGPRIRNYFNTLYKLKSTDIADYDTNNVYGLPMAMDANACASMLYNSHFYQNVDTMIDGIEEIGKRIKGFEAFVKFAQDLKNNRDFATEVFSVFAKIKMFAYQVVVEEGVPTLRISNETADSRAAYAFYLRNDIKSTIHNDISTSKSFYNAISNYVSNIKGDMTEENKAKLRLAKNKLAKLLKLYFPSITEAAVISYIEINNNASDDVVKQCNNINALLKDIDTIIKKTETCLEKEESMVKEASAIKKHNDELDKARENKKWVDPSEYKSLKSVYTDDYIKPVDGAIQNITSKLVRFEVVKTKLNYSNVNGNNKSSVINTSLITQLSDMISETREERNAHGGVVYKNERLLAWGAKKLGNSSQYKYSALLVEQTDDEGNILNEGTAIFKYVDGQLCLSDNVGNILQVRQLDGASNLDTGENVDYSKMGTGEYLPTSYISFFKTMNRRSQGDSFGTYLLRIPSDAPNTFAIRAPRYNTSGLMIIADEDRVNADVDKITKSIYSHTTPAEEFYSKYENEKTNSEKTYINIDEDKLKNLLREPESVFVENFYAIKPISEPDTEGKYEGYVVYKCGDIEVAFRGTIEKAGNGKKIVNPKLEAATVPDMPTETRPLRIISETIRDYYKNKLLRNDVTIGDVTYAKATYKANTNHKVFKLLKNQFKQEVLDAAIALDHYFEFKQINDREFVVQLDKKTGKPIFKDKNGNTKGYAFYHLDENGVVFTKNGNKFTLNGNVFHSNRFTLAIEDEKGNVVKRNYLDELFGDDTAGADDGKINLLYGGAMTIIKENGKVADVKFSDVQKAAIDEKLSEFLNDYINQCTNFIEDYKDFIQSISTSIENVTEFSVNQLIMHFVYDDIFDGNSKFYKDTQTVLKRVKQHQGAGVPYGISNYAASFVPSLSNVEHSYLNEGFFEEEEKESYVDENGKTKIRTKKNDNGKPIVNKIYYQDFFKGTIFEGTTQRQGFQAVTIKNTKMTNTKVLNELVEKLVKIGVSREHAMDMLFGFPEIDEKTKKPKMKDGEIVRRGGFTETKVNDAQSYITVQEWVRRIAARGQLQRHFPLIKKLTDPNAILTAEEIDQFIQIQKNFYYDLYYDKNYGIEVPRQIKNAEFVLVPQLIKGTQLEQVYNLMRDAEIDQLNTVETSKAANEELITLWDNNGDITKESYDAFHDKAVANRQIFSYNNLYTQQETPQHMNDTNKAGIQIVKKIIDNIPDSGHPLSAAKREYFTLFVENIKSSATELFKNFELPLDEKGNLILNEDGSIKGLNLKVFYNKLKEEMQRLGMDTNLLDYVNIPDDSSAPLMPAYMNNILTKFESIVQSLFNNNITRQKLPGFHAAQVTNVGWRAIAESKEQVSYSKDLAYHPNEFKHKENGKIISQRDYDKLSSEEKSNYEDIGPSSYVEVMLPYSFLGIDKNSEHYKNMTDEEILAELAAEDKNGFGLDTIIGYRIPTEGKQSVCRMKVVGFISDGYGSTIVVPNDWVSQTGSDFDIDSVYGIQSETYKTKDGQIKKIKYKQKLTKYDWFQYVRRLAENKKDLDPNVSENVKAAYDEVASLLNKEYEVLQKEENEIWNKFTKEQKEGLKNIDKNISKLGEYKSSSGRERYRFRINEYIKRLKKLQDKQKDKNSEFYHNLQELIDKQEEIDNFLDAQTNKFTTESQERIDKILAERQSKFDASAKKIGALTLEEYLNPSNVASANSDKARNSRILELMQTILDSNASLEENLSRSNFDNITLNRNNDMNPSIKAERAARSPYNWIDQMRYQEEAMSGAKLKAFSVTLDTFCSVCNTVKPTLTKPVYVVYDTENYSNHEDILKRFNNSKNINAKTFSIRHDSYGWSKDYRNVDNYILTSYSSQTTAFILDAIKEGSLPNVNDYTFAVFKTLANLGCDYRTSLRFIMQPGVSEIVKQYNANKSIFSSVKGNPIHLAIRSIATQLGIRADSKTPIVAVLNSLNARYGEQFNKLFGQKGDEKITIGLKDKDTENLPIIVSKLGNRLKNKGEFKSSSPVEDKLLFDLGTILIFNNLNKTANEIADIARCCNPDKFGAKQTVFATRQVFDNIDKCIYDREDINNIISTEDGKRTKVERNPILKVGDKHILASIYPGVDNLTGDVDDIVKDLATNDRSSESSYPSLYAFLKYASATSVIVGKRVFDTQDTKFVNFVTNLKSVFSGYNPEISEETYNDFQRYLLSSIYKSCPSIAFKVEVRKSDNGIKLQLDSNADLNKSDVENENTIRKETERIYGYSRRNNTDIVIEEEKYLSTGERYTTKRTIPFTVKDINNPTDNEMKLFETLSPAQKVQWIQQHFEDSGIFAFLNVSLFNGKQRGKKAGMQTIEFVEQNVSSNLIYAEFNKAYYNDNPLVVSAAIDIVKYAVQVEGLKMSATAVNKIIDNDCLIDSFENGGLGFVDYIRQEMNDIKNSQGRYSKEEEVSRIYENYLRSHPENKSIRTFYITQNNKTKYNFQSASYGMYYIKKGESKKTYEANTKEFNESLVGCGIKYYLPISDTYRTNEYIRIVNNKVNRLYKICDGGEYIILYPLGELNTFENARWSTNEEFNTGIVSKLAYELFVEQYAKDYKTQVFNYEYVKARIDAFKKDGKTKDFWYEKRKLQPKYQPAKSFNLEEEAKKGGSLASVATAIRVHFANPENIGTKLYINNRVLRDYILSPGVEYGSIQKITILPNDTRRFIITIPDKRWIIAKEWLNTDEDDNYLDANTIVNPYLREIIGNAQGRYINLDNMFEVIPVMPETDYSSWTAAAEEVHVEGLDFAAARAAAGETNSIALMHDMKVAEISRTVESIKPKNELVTREVAKYAKKMSKLIKDEYFDRFCENPSVSNSYFSIDAPEVQALIKQDAKLMDKYITFCNMAKGFVDTFSHYRDVKSDDAEIKSFIEDINKSVAVISNLPIDDLKDKAIHIIADKETSNPRIKEGLLDVMDGYWKTYGHMWNFNDIMENGTPILQIMLKDVMGDIDAKQKMTHKQKKRYWNKVRAIQEMAKAHGMTVDINKIIDKDGNFIRDYKPEFAEKLNELREERDKCALTYGIGSVKHLIAKYNYDVFKANYINQEAKQEYYLRKCALERDMLENHKEVYSEYMKLYLRELQIYDYAGKDELPEELANELKEIKRKKSNLTSPFAYIDEQGNYINRPLKEENVRYTTEQLKEIAIYGYDANIALNSYIGSLAALNKEYFVYDESYGFREQLNNNLQIVNSLEKRDANGVPTVSSTVLNQIPRYVEAKEWLRKNAAFVLRIRPNNDKDLSSIGYQLKLAFEVLKLTKQAKNRSVQHIINEHNNNEGINDANGIPDGRLITEAENQEIRKRILLDWGISGMPMYSDRKLISNAKHDENQDSFSQEFYKNMTTNGTSSIDYMNVVTEINKILAKYIVTSDGYTHIENIPDTPEGIAELNELANLYQKLRSIKKKTGSTNSKQVAQFIEENVEFEKNVDLYRNQYLTIAHNSEEYKEAFRHVVLELDEEGNYATNAEGKFILNSYLYSFAKPKGKPGDESYDKWIEKSTVVDGETLPTRSEARKTIEKYYARTTTEYYDMAQSEAWEKDKTNPGYYKEWYEKNHIYNPFTRKMEPLPQWTTNRLRVENIPESEYEGGWIPKGDKRKRQVVTAVIGRDTEGNEVIDTRRDKRNLNYDPNAGLLGNYIKGANGGNYDSNAELNQYEKEMRKYLYELLMSTANVDSAKRWFKTGHLPLAMKPKETTAKSVVKEVGKMFGIGISTDNGEGSYFKEIGYQFDRTPLMPMTQLLNNKQTIDLKKELDELENTEIKKEEFPTQKDYEDKLKEVEERKKELKERIRTERQNIINNDWYNVIDNYLDQASRYNAVLDNKQKLYFLHNTLKTMKMYSRSKGGYGDLKKDTRDKDGNVLEKSVDTALIEQYETFLRRLLFDQWKESEGLLTKGANMLQGFTSANFMMLNLRGGFANITLGETNILAEAAAKEYFGKKDWTFGTGEWMKGSIGFGRSAYHNLFYGKDVAFNKQDAIIKFMNVVDYDAQSGVVHKLSMEEYSKKLRDLMFSPQTMGEHFMQNSVLFAMMNCHKIFTVDGKPEILNERQYIDMRIADNLVDILDEEQLSAYAEFKESLKLDKNKLKDYIWFRKDTLTDFIYLHCSKEQIEQFIKLRKEKEDEYKKEYDEVETLYEQCELGSDGKLAFKPGSQLESLDNVMSDNVGEVTEAMALLGRFAEKVRKVNNKIHGVYNEMGSANIEKKWYGALVMQYHKHLPIGLLKHWRARGQWNETRGNVDKGLAQSIIDVASLNLRKIRVDAGLTDEQVGALEGFVYTLTHCASYLQQMRTTLRIIPNYEKANLLRNLGEVIGVIGAMSTVAALWYIAQDDEEMQESYAFNFFLYQADRLASEAFLYNPIGLANETKKLMSTPIAAEQIVEDAISAVGALGDWLLDDEYDPYYHSGRFAGEHKLSVYVQRRIPMWSAIRSIIDLPSNNQYYKLGQNPIGMFNIKDKVTND